MEKIIEDLQKATKELAPIIGEMNKNNSKKRREELKKKLNASKNNMERLLRENTRVLSDLIIEKKDSRALVVAGEAIGLYLKAEGITSSQMRNIFGYAKKIDQEVKNTNEPLSDGVVHKLLLLSPKLAYVAGREKSRDKKGALELLRDFFDRCVEKIGTDAKKFKRFIDLFESILSYHKFYGAK